MIAKNTVPVLITLLIASAATGCSRPPTLNLSSQQIAGAYQGTLDDARREARAETIEASRLETHFNWLRRRGAKPIDEASARERELARAVVRISAIGDTYGTGFFISPDGLLLTNEHVGSSEFCSRDRCVGYAFQRGFSPQGDFEVFTRARAVAFSPAEGGADFALLQIELPPGHTVPYIPLEMGDIPAALEKARERDSLRLIGHPFGAPARVLPVTYINHHNEGRQMSYSSLGTPGTSGSPIVDLETGRAVALNSLLLFMRLDDEVAFDGSLVRARNMGTLSHEILRRLRDAYPELTGQAELSGRDFASWTSHAAERRLRSITLPSPSNDSNATHPEVAPGLAEYFLSSEERSALRIKPSAPQAELGFFHHFYGTPYAVERWDALLETLLNAGQPRAVLDMFSGVVRAHRATNIPIPTTEAKINEWAARLSSVESITQQDLVLFQVAVAREMGIEIMVEGEPFDCPAFVASQQGSPLERATALSALCASRELPNPDGTTVNGLALLLDAVRVPDDQWDEETDTYLAGEALKQLAMAGSWRGGELEIAREIVRNLIGRSPTWMMIAHMESLKLKLDRAPESAVPGGAAGTMDASSLPPESEISAQLTRLRAALRLPEPEPITE